MFSALLALAVLWPDPPAVDQALSGKQHTGVYISLFETSLFEPCDNDERWWLEARNDVNELLWKRVDELRAQYEDETGTPLSFASPPMYLIAKGDVSELGDYGHMGQYDRRFDVIKFSEFRLATNDELIQCVASGFLPIGPSEKK